MDTQEQVDFWRRSSDEDFAAAESLLEKGHLRHCLFFAHLAIEKMLKALVSRRTQDIPPRIHSLTRLSKIAVVEAGPEREDFLREFGIYQMEGRYPDSEQIRLNSGFVKAELANAREMLEWLKKQF